MLNAFSLGLQALSSHQAKWAALVVLAALVAVLLAAVIVELHLLGSTHSVGHVALYVSRISPLCGSNEGPCS